MFCFLEKDDKTYRYLLMVIERIRENMAESLVKLDNLLQTKEIRNHLSLNRLPENDGEETMNWIRRHGRGFRDYLNTIKVAAMMWVWAEETNEPSWEDFSRLVDRLDSTKACLDAIHE
ncbi:MAG TPA: hypothetical protein VFB30_04080 [Spirochaetia bacterium]|nr:hypothetical protein [Spirochaetia bacterium]